MTLCERASAASLNVVPHLSVVDPQDWDFWRDWLVRNPKVRRVAVEFETGYKCRVDGIDAIGRLACVQKAIPFSKAVRRQRVVSLPVSWYGACGKRKTAKCLMNCSRTTSGFTRLG
jgi:hypothetical protein